MGRYLNLTPTTTHLVRPLIMNKTDKMGRTLDRFDGIREEFQTNSKLATRYFQLFLDSFSDYAD